TSDAKMLVRNIDTAPNQSSTRRGANGLDQTSYSLIVKSATWTAPSRKVRGAGCHSRKYSSHAFRPHAPQCARCNARDEPFRSAIREHLKGHTQGRAHGFFLPRLGGCLPRVSLQKRGSSFVH